MDVEALISATLREAGHGPDAIGSALPRIMRILQAEDVRIEMGRSLSRKEREYVWKIGVRENRGQSIFSRTVQARMNIAPAAPRGNR